MEAKFRDEIAISKVWSDLKKSRGSSFKRLYYTILPPKHSVKKGVKAAKGVVYNNTGP